jgi:hypothetical protein
VAALGTRRSASRRGGGRSATADALRLTPLAARWEPGSSRDRSFPCNSRAAWPVLWSRAVAGLGSLSRRASAPPG